MAIPPGAIPLETLRPALIRYAQHLVHNQWMAEDIVHDTLLAVLENPDRFRGQSSYTTYVFSILRNKMFDALRSAKRHPSAYQYDEEHDHIEESEAPDTPRAESPCAALEQEEFLRTVDEGLRQLPERLARAFVLSYGFEFSNKEICDAMRLSNANLWTMLHRARSALKQHLQLRPQPGRLAGASSARVFA